MTIYCLRSPITLFLCRETHLCSLRVRVSASSGPFPAPLCQKLALLFCHCYPAQPPSHIIFFSLVPSFTSFFSLCLFATPCCATCPFLLFGLWLLFISLHFGLKPWFCSLLGGLLTQFESHRLSCNVWERNNTEKCLPNAQCSIGEVALIGSAIFEL